MERQRFFQLPPGIFQKFLVVLPWHRNINVVVPWNKAFMADSPQKAPMNHEPGDSVLLTDLVYRLQHGKLHFPDSLHLV